MTQYVISSPQCGCLAFGDFLLPTGDAIDVCLAPTVHTVRMHILYAYTYVHTYVRTYVYTYMMHGAFSYSLWFGWGHVVWLCVGGIYNHSSTDEEPSC